MARAPRHPKSARGVTLLEALVSLTILLVGMLGMMQLQIFGITSDSGARAQTQALQLARELAAALEKLDSGHALLAPHWSSATPPAEFGRQVTASGTLATSGFRAWSDASPLAGVTTDAALLASAGADPTDAAAPRFRRRWSVWQSQSASTASGVKLVAVSVTYQERTLPGLREVVLLTQVSNQGLVSSFASAFR